jgi:Na+/melibiose symporter-like transporter
MCQLRKIQQIRSLFESSSWMQSWHVFCAFVPFTLSIPAWLWLSHRYGKRSLWVFSNLLGALAFGGAFFVGEGDRLAIILLIAVIGAAFGCGRMMAPSIQADVIDFDEYLTGERKEGVYFAAYGLITKGAGFRLNEAEHAALRDELDKRASVASANSP